LYFGGFKSDLKHLEKSVDKLTLKLDELNQTVSDNDKELNKNLSLTREELCKIQGNLGSSSK
jgi:hypothetical protein